jgi:hypothetical protein
VDDVDLFVGMFSERPMKGALVGPITLCIVGDQFARLKKGDRFFYDLGGQQGEAAFTPSQLTEVGYLGLNICTAFLKFFGILLVPVVPLKSRFCL